LRFFNASTTFPCRSQLLCSRCFIFAGHARPFNLRRARKKQPGIIEDAERASTQARRYSRGYLLPRSRGIIGRRPRPPSLPLPSEKDPRIRNYWRPFAFRETIGRPNFLRRAHGVILAANKGSAVSMPITVSR
jgi:hypothetical protein